MPSGKPKVGAFNESGEIIVDPASPPPPIDGFAADSKKKAKATKPKSAPASKAKKAAPQPRPGAAADPEKLVCRYCGSDDLAPSFRKRRDARCRACFKQRYGSAARAKKSARTTAGKAAK